jgi:hypothetical protein
MADPTPTAAPQIPQGLAELYALNGKLLFDETLKDMSELQKTYEQQALQVLTDAHQLALKTQADAQSAANVHLLNVIGTAHKMSEASLVHLATVAANEEAEQEDEADTTIDDLAKVMESMTVQLNGVITALNAVVANMATGRPPVNQSGTTGTAVAS